MAKDLVMGLDLGTSGCKAVVVDRAGNPVGPACLEGVDGLATQSPGEVWRAAGEAMRRAGEAIEPSCLAGLAVSGAMHSLLLVDAAGAPLADATTWADQRGTELLDALRSDVDADDLYQRTGCPLGPLYHLTRLRWWRQHEAEIWRRTHRAVSLKSFVVHQLTGEWVEDVSVASATGLLNIADHTWDAAALGAAGIGEERLPRLCAVDEVVGRITPKAAQNTGFPEGLPVIAGASDGALANIGAAGDEPDRMVITIGTSAAARVITDHPRLDSLCRSWCYAIDDRRWLSGCAMNNGGSALAQVRKRLYADVPDDQAYGLMMREAAEVEAGCDRLVVWPFFMDERGTPWRRDVAQVIPDHTHPAKVTGVERGRVVRAIIEGVAMCVAEMVSVVEPAGDVSAKGEPGDVNATPSPALPARGRERVVRLTGGVAGSTLWQGIVADAMDRPVLPIDLADASAIGAAMVGGRALGLPCSPVEPDAHRVVQPNPAHTVIYAARREQLRQWADPV